MSGAIVIVSLMADSSALTSLSPERRCLGSGYLRL